MSDDVLAYDAWRDPDEFDDVDDDPLVHRYEQRVTVDFDGKHHATAGAFRFEAIRTWHNLRDVADRVDVHVSTGQHGLHFVAWFEADLEFEGQMSVRRSNGDDPRRVDMDRQRFEQLGGRFTDVLFQQLQPHKSSSETRHAGRVKTSIV